MSSLTLVIPELLTPLALGQVTATHLPNLSHVQRLFSRAQRAQDVLTDVEALLCRLFHVALPANTPLPVAALSYLSDCKSIEPGWYLRVDPVHLQVGRDKLILLDQYVLQATADEATQLIAELNQSWQDRGVVIHQGAPGRWYIHLSDAPQCQTSALADVVGRNIQAYLMEGIERQRWQAYTNEVQMLLHASPVNAAREAQGRPAINSVWLWGEGSLEQLGRTDFVTTPMQVYSDDPVVTGLGSWSGADVFALPDDAETWLSQCDVNAEQVIVMNHPAQALRHGDEGQWLEFLVRFNTFWAPVLMQLLAEKKLTQLMIHLPAQENKGFSYRLTPRLQARWWKRNRSLVSISK